MALLVGDERAKQLCDVYPELAETCTLAWYPQGRLEKILAGAIMRINSSYKVLVIVALLHDFVIEKHEHKSLFMVNPDITSIGETLSKFSNKVKSINPRMHIIMTVPAYVDFIQYSKRLKHLTRQDFARLESFTAQMMTSFTQVHDGVRYMARNTFSFNMNITLRDPTKQVVSRTGRLYNAASQMQFAAGTLTDGFHLSDDANRRVAAEIHKRVVNYAAKQPDIDSVSFFLLCSNETVIKSNSLFQKIYEMFTDLII